MSTAIFFVAFQGAIGGGDNSYFLFVYSGIILWQFFAGSLSLGAVSFLQNAEMVKKIYFPRFILPNSVIPAKLLDLTVALIVMVPVVLYINPEVNWFRLLFFGLLSIVMAIVISSGCAMVISSFMVKYRGIQSFLPFGIHILFLTSSAMYDPNVFIEYDLVNTLFQFNPMSGVFYVFRIGVLNDPLNPKLLMGYLLWSCIIFIVGFSVFWIRNRKIPDYL